MIIAMIICLISVLSVTGSGSPHQSTSAKRSGIQQADFANHTYRVPDRDPDRDPVFEPVMTHKRTEVTLRNGRYEAESPVGRDWVRVDLRSVSYGDLTRDGQPEAIVSLSVATDGTQRWGVLFVYASDKRQLRTLQEFWTGDRSNQGLHRAYSERGCLIVEIYDPDTADGDCCATRAFKIRFRWDGSKFIELGREAVAIAQ